MKKRKIMPKDQQKLGMKMNGKDSLALFISETLNVEIIDNKIDFSSNEEFIEILEKKNNKNN